MLGPDCRDELKLTLLIGDGNTPSLPAVPRIAISKVSTARFGKPRIRTPKV